MPLARQARAAIFFDHRMGAAFAALLAGHGGRHAGRHVGLVQRQHLLLGRLGAAGQDVLHGIGDGGHLGVVPQRYARAVGAFVRSQAHGAAVPLSLINI